MFAVVFFPLFPLLILKSRDRWDAVSHSAPSLIHPQVAGVRSSRALLAPPPAPEDRALARIYFNSLRASRQSPRSRRTRGALGRRSKLGQRFNARPSPSCRCHPGSWGGRRICRGDPKTKPAGAGNHQLLSSGVLVSSCKSPDATSSGGREFAYRLLVFIISVAL